jgi:hypothetical protein
MMFSCHLAPALASQVAAGAFDLSGSDFSIGALALSARIAPPHTVRDPLASPTLWDPDEAAEFEERQP